LNDPTPGGSERRGRAALGARRRLATVHAAGSPCGELAAAAVAMRLAMIAAVLGVLPVARRPAEPATIGAER
jgi:hypothetical protein